MNPKTYEQMMEENARIDFMNSLLQQNPGNRGLQGTLMDQYMGMMFPEPVDYGSQLSEATQMIAAGQEMGIQELIDAGNAKLRSNPMITQYLGSDSGNAMSESEKALQNYDLEQFSSLYPTEGEDINRDVLGRNVELQGAVKSVNGV